MSRPIGCPEFRTAIADGGHRGSRPGGWETGQPAAETVLGVEKEDIVGYEIMEPVSMEDPGSEVKGLRCHPRISGSLTHKRCCLPGAHFCIREHGRHSLAESQPSKSSPHNSIRSREDNSRRPQDTAEKAFQVRNA